MRRDIVTILLSLFLVGLHAGVGLAVDIDACGATVASGTVGVLATDLVCDANLGEQIVDAALLIEAGGELDMNGHSLTVLGSSQGIRCDGRCIVTSHGVESGEIVRGDAGGFAGILGVHVVRASKLLITGDWSDGIRANKQVRLEDVSCVGTKACVSARKIRATRVTATDGESGILARKALRAYDVVVSDNSRWAIDAGNRMRGDNVTVTNNGMMGIDASLGSPGKGGPIRLSNSVVTGNPIDLYTPRPPKISNTTCETSRNSKDGTTWGVCSAD